MAKCNVNTQERFADIQMLRYELKGFENLSLTQKIYIYCLSKATLLGRDDPTQVVHPADNASCFHIGSSPLKRIARIFCTVEVFAGRGELCNGMENSHGLHVTKCRMKLASDGHFLPDMV